MAEVLPRYLYDLRPPELASLCRAFAEVALYNEPLSDALGAEAPHIKLYQQLQATANYTSLYIFLYNAYIYYTCFLYNILYIFEA